MQDSEFRPNDGPTFVTDACEDRLLALRHDEELAGVANYRAIIAYNNEVAEVAVRSLIWGSPGHSPFELRVFECNLNPYATLRAYAVDRWKSVKIDNLEKACIRLNIPQKVAQNAVIKPAQAMLDQFIAKANLGMSHEDEAAAVVEIPKRRSRRKKA